MTLFFNMAVFLFVDESGQAHSSAPYEVLAGLAVNRKELWDFIRIIHDFEVECFGLKYGNDRREIKARKFLNRRTFAYANQFEPFKEEVRTLLAKEALERGRRLSRIHLAALAQAKLGYVTKVLNHCTTFNCKVFSCIVANPNGAGRKNSMLPKEYVYLFERFYYFLESQQPEEDGTIIFDEVEKSMSRLRIIQMNNYFQRSYNGTIRSSLILPEPIFVHSDLTTGIQVADLIAYVISWNFRNARLTKPRRPELNPFLKCIRAMEFKYAPNTGAYPYKIKSIITIDNHG